MSCKRKGFSLQEKPKMPTKINLSLRRHYPDQVKGSAACAALSAKAPPVRIHLFFIISIQDADVKSASRDIPPGLLIRDIHVRSDLNIVLRVNLLNLFVKDLNSFLGTDVEAHHDIEHHFLRFCIHIEAMELDTIPITALKAASNTFARIPMILVRMIT